MVVGESKRFDYTGNIQTIVLEPGKYKLECCGAQGYAILNDTGGKDSYAIITLLDDNKRKNSNLYKDSYNQETFDFNKLLEV